MGKLTGFWAQWMSGRGLSIGLLTEKVRANAGYETCIDQRSCPNRVSPTRSTQKTASTWDARKGF